MKLQYERYFAKLMQAQPVHCIPNAVPTTRMGAESTPLTAMSTSTQIPVLWPAVAAPPPTASQPIGSLSGLKSEVTAAPVAAQPTAGHMEALAETQPRMWTFAMATPTPAGLLLSGAPTMTMAGGTLPTTAATFELFQYPLGYGPIMQQQPLHQQMSYATTTTTGSSVALGNRGDILQSDTADLRENKQSVLNKSEVTDNTVLTAEAATSTEFPSMEDKSAGEMSNMQTETMPHSINIVEANSDMKGTAYPSSTANGKFTQLSSTQPLEKLSRHQSENAISMKASAESPTAIFREPSPAVSEVINSVSGVKLEDVDIMDEAMSHTEPAVSSEEPKMYSRHPYNFEADRNSTISEDDWKEGKVINLNTAEDHRRKIAEIEQRYGTIEIEENNNYVNRNINTDSNETFTDFKRFLEIVNPKDGQSLQSHTGPIENALIAPMSNMSSASKSISSSKIDNIENAIYGELVNPQLPETEMTPTRTAAQGFFTELLEQQETPLENNKLQERKAQEHEYTTKGEIDTSNLSENTEYLNYNPTIENGDTGDLKPENSINETSDSQYQATYGTSNAFTAESAYGIAESANNYTEYTTGHNIEANSTDTTDQQQQEQRPDYSQQDYESYDTTQYANYDPNAYPGYIYDEATGQYVVDPKYTASDASNAEAIYTAQDFTQPQEQQQQLQIEYSNDPVQEVNYAYEDSKYSAAAPTTTEQSVFDPAATPTETTNLQMPPPASHPPLITAVPSTPKVVKPTSILSTAEKHAVQSEAQKKKKRVNFVDSSETDDSSSVKAPAVGAAVAGSESDFDFSSGAETSVG